ncbi:glycerol-3-phosphate dehydrogenase/oxidase [Kocuria palustris]|uniref:glycerol-3-phosphate dehydrogenase/oxidase n=1 Tax=Kocuria palustris TaxID=71999 RepID=UPI0011A3B69B|nr:glycerol-3-phosphate dehydrogenase/oxidase [Kocuria palustris]
MANTGFTTDRSALNPESRARALEQMENGPQLDVLVVGGGITGAGIALDAATRGLRVGIVEGQDWAGATSRSSSKLVHGGLRYLQQLDVKLVAEALGERERLLYTLAPHLVEPVPFLYPLQKGWERPYVGTGIGLYDTLAHLNSKVTSLPKRQHLSTKEVLEQFPDFREDASVGAFKYWDAKVDDARLVVTLVRTAARNGALAANRTEVVDLLHEEDEFQDGSNVVGARVRDKETGREFPVRASSVISAAGVWTEGVQELAPSDAGLKVLASKGVHIVVPRERIRGEVGLILQTEKSVLFVIPWAHHWIIGTTDTPYEHSLDTPTATAADIDYVIAHANEVLDDPLTRDDVIGTYAGLRPLLQPVTRDGQETASTKVSREHTVMEPVPGLVTIAGGKLTTYRIMAQDAVDLALGEQEAARRPSITDRTMLLGADGVHALRARIPLLLEELRQAAPDPEVWTEQRLRDLIARYGSELHTVLALIEEDPSLGRPLEGAPVHLRAEIVHACRAEGALHLEDLLDTRTRLTYAAPNHGDAAVDEIADLAAAELGWDGQRRDREVEAYRSRSAAEDAAARTEDEQSAEQARDAAEPVVEGLSVRSVHQEGRQGARDREADPMGD